MGETRGVTGFSESWLADYRRRSAGFGQVRQGSEPICYDFKLRRPTPSLNVTLRQHWTARSRLARDLAEEIAGLLRDAILPSQPWPYARLVLVRRCVRVCDEDNFRGGIKALCDALQPRSERHPNSLAIIADDSPDHLVQWVSQVRVARRIEQGTDVKIQRMDQPP